MAATALAFIISLETLTVFITENLLLTVLPTARLVYRSWHRHSGDGRG